MNAYPFARIAELPALQRSAALTDVLKQLLVSGGDTRLELDAKTELNGYGCQATPRPEELAYSSSTASTISERAFAVSDAAIRELAARAAVEGAVPVFAQTVEAVRSELKTLLELDQSGVDVVFSPSGTDAEIQALFLARRVLGPDVSCFIIASDETGNGVPLSASGHHFNDTASSGQEVPKGSPIAGLGAETILIPARNKYGARPLADVDDEVSQSVYQAVTLGKRVILHVMDHSNFGTRAPSPACIDDIRATYGSAVQVVVDACQFRLSRKRLRRYLDQGFLVLVTGSKFFAGPPLSGALLVPQQLRAGLTSIDDVPAGLADYTTQLDWPENLHSIGKKLPRRGNLGQLLRWIAAIEEMRAYYAVPEKFRRMALAEFAAAVTRSIGESTDLELLPQPEWLAAGADDDDEFSVRTIFPFLMNRNGGRVSLAEAHAIYKALNEDVARLVPIEDFEQAKLASQHCHIGEPVSITERSGATTGALRISADARFVSECFGGTDIDAAVENMRRTFDQLDVIFAKARLLLRDPDALKNGYQRAA